MRKGGGRGGGDNPHVETTMHLNWEGRIHWGGGEGGEGIILWCSTDQ